MEVTVHDWPRHVLGIDAAKHSDAAPVSAEDAAGCEGASEGVLDPEGFPPVPGHAVHLHCRVGSHESPGAAHQHQVVRVGQGARAKSGSKEAALKGTILDLIIAKKKCIFTSDTTQDCPS